MSEPSANQGVTTAIPAPTRGGQPGQEQSEAPASKWGELPSEDRQRELDGYLLAWEQLGPEEQAKRLAENRGPFASAPLFGSDAYYLAIGVIASQPAPEGSGGDRTAAEQLLREVHTDFGVRMNLSLAGLHLEGAGLTRTHLERAGLSGAHLEGAYLSGAHLEGAVLMQAHLERADLREAHLEGATLDRARLENAGLSAARLERAVLREAHLEGTFLDGAHLEGTNLYGAHLERTKLRRAHLEGANLAEAHLEGATLDGARLEGVSLRGAFLDAATALGNVRLPDSAHNSVFLADVRWGGANLSVVDWGPLRILGDETQARQRKDRKGEAKGRATRLGEHKAAVRANRQLAVALQTQGLSEDAARFAYRAQVLQRRVYRLQGFRKLGAYLFSLMIAALAGYGYRLWRIAAAYALVLLTFATAYFATALLTASPMPWHHALLISFTAIHGRVFLGQFGLDSALSWIAGIEAVTGIVIEGVFVAMLIQRFFGR